MSQSNCFRSGKCMCFLRGAIQSVQAWPCTRSVLFVQWSSRQSYRRRATKFGSWPRRPMSALASSLCEYWLPGRVQFPSFLALVNLVGSSGDLTWARLGKLQEQSYPVLALSVCGIGVFACGKPTATASVSGDLTWVRLQPLHPSQVTLPG